MIAKIQRWGNSQGIRFSREVLKQVHIAVGDEVAIEVHDNEIRVKPVKPTRGKYSLRKLLSNNKMKSGELDWGPSVGKEVW